MPDIFCYGDYERSEAIYDLLLKLKKLCIVPDCTQHKAYKNGSPYCYAHEKERKGLMDLDTHYRGVL